MANKICVIPLLTKSDFQPVGETVNLTARCLASFASERQELKKYFLSKRVRPRKKFITFRMGPKIPKNSLQVIQIALFATLSHVLNHLNDIFSDFIGHIRNVLKVCYSAIFSFFLGQALFVKILYFFNSWQQTRKTLV